MKKKINIAIADDHELVVQGFIELLKTHNEFGISFTVSNGKELLEKLKNTVPDILLLDLEMPVMSGNEVFDHLKMFYPQLKIIIISATFRPSIVFNYVKKKTNSFLHKNCSREELFFTIKEVYNTGRYFNEHVTSIVAKEVSDPTVPGELVQFTADELKYLKYLSEGLTNKEIATKMNIEQRASEWIKSTMMRKINTNNTNVLLVYAAKHNLI